MSIFYHIVDFGLPIFFGHASGNDVLKKPMRSANRGFVAADEEAEAEKTTLGAQPKVGHAWFGFGEDFGEGRADQGTEPRQGDRIGGKQGREFDGRTLGGSQRGERWFQQFAQELGLMTTEFHQVVGGGRVETGKTLGAPAPA